MKIHSYDPEYNIDLSGSGGVIASNYSRTSLGSNTPLIESGAGSPGSGPQAAAWDHVHPAAGGSSSFGSNSTRVASVSAAGASSSNSRADHVHDGIGTVTASGSNTLNRGTFNLRAGTGIALALSNTDGGSGFDTATIHNIAAASGGGGSVSYGSNSTRVSSVPSAGASSLVSRADHVHDGITSSGGSTTQQGTLKPSSPTDDFDASTLNGAWSAHATRGSFTTGSVFTQALNGSHVSLGFQDFHGTIWRSTTNVDQEFLAGGLTPTVGGAYNYMAGIAILDSAGTGVAIVSYNDGNCYLATITTWGYTSFSGSVALFAHSAQQALGPLAMRLVRVGNVFTGHVSSDGCNWYVGAAGSFSATLTKTITADRVVIGTFYDAATLYTGRYYCDWAHKI